MGFVAVAIVLAALYWAQEVLIPLALAVLFCFLLAPLVKRLERWGVRRIPAVVLVVLFAFTVLAGTSYMVASQLISLTAKFPEYKGNIQHKVLAFRQSTEARLGRITETFRDIRGDFAAQPATHPANGREQAGATAGAGEARSPAAAPQTAPAAPITVQVVEPSSRQFAIVGDTLGLVGKPLATSVILAVLVIFILVREEDLRDRFICLMGRGQINMTTAALEDAGERISRYLLMQLIINASYGIPVAIGLYLIGVPNAALWGLLATLLRYLPYIGAWIAASLPILLSLAVFDDWGHLIAVVGLFLALELVVANFIEPWLYGSTTGLSTVAVIFAAVFWAWLWGPVGLLLSTPLTVCLVVMGKYVPQLEFLTILLGDEPVLDPRTRFYQRLLSDQEEAVDLVHEYREDKPLVEVYDEMVVPALHLAEQDRSRGRLDPDREEQVIEGIRTIVEELGEPREEGKKPSQPSAGHEELEPAARARHAEFHVLCIPAHDEADELVGQMLTQVLQNEGYAARNASATLLSGEIAREIDKAQPHLVCVSSLPPGAATHARYACKRLRTRIPYVPIIVGLWDTNGDLNIVQGRLQAAGAAKVVSTFKDALDEIARLAQRAMLQQEPARAEHPA
jgi:predicted PurR-regulated permease PerM